MELKRRNEVDVNLTWDLSLIYENEDVMNKDWDKMNKLAHDIEKKYKDKINSAQMINECLDEYKEFSRIERLIGSYTELAQAVDYYDTHAMELCHKFSKDSSASGSRLSFIDSEILNNEEEIIKEAMDHSKENRRYLKDLLKAKKHRLSSEAERILALVNPALETPYVIYNTSKLADMKFDAFVVNGKSYPLGYSLYEDDYEYELDTDVRRASFDAFSKKLKEYENTTAAAYNAHVQNEKMLADMRGYDNVFDALLDSQNVTREMYEQQIDTIMSYLAPHMQKYAKLKQRIHKLDKMTYVDLKIALDPSYDPKVTIEQSRDFIKNGLSIFGKEYQEMIDKAYDERWIDFARNQGKTTGGFCAFVPHKNCYILLSWNDRMSDVFTLSHELGHTGNALMADKQQSLFDSMPPFYLGEAPSTTNELLMAHYLLKTNDDKRFRRWVLSCMISNTYYHNFVTHFLEAYYQREVYRIIDAHGSVNAPVLNNLFKDTLTKFWGDAVELNEGAELTWMRQPHYYMGLYSYTYSAGLSLGTNVALRIEKEGQKAVDDWKAFLASGCIYTPKEIGELVKVDLTKTDFLINTINYIGSIIDEIEKLTEELGE